MKIATIIPATLDEILNVVAPTALNSGNMALQLTLAGLLMLSAELWRLCGRQ